MNYESIGKVTLPKIGFGTWTIGGRMSPDRARDDWSLAALRSALELGYTHFDTAEMYAGGHAEELLGQAIRESAIPRETLFITSKLLPSNLQYDRVLRSCEASLRRLGLVPILKTPLLIQLPNGKDCENTHQTTETPSPCDTDQSHDRRF